MRKNFIIFSLLLLVILYCCTKDPSKFRITEETKSKIIHCIYRLNQLIWGGDIGQKAESGLMRSLYESDVYDHHMELVVIHIDILHEYQEKGYNDLDWEKTDVGSWFKDYFEWWEKVKKSNFNIQYYAGQLIPYSHQLLTK